LKLRGSARDISWFLDGKPNASSSKARMFSFFTVISEDRHSYCFVYFITHVFRVLLRLFRQISLDRGMLRRRQLSEQWLVRAVVRLFVAITKSLILDTENVSLKGGKFKESTKKNRSAIRTNP
jgi:hypothetical protein